MTEIQRERREVLRSILAACSSENRKIQNAEDFRNNLGEIANQSNIDQTILLQIYKALFRASPETLPTVSNLANILFTAFKDESLRPSLREKFETVTPEEIVQMAEEINQRKKSGRTQRLEPENKKERILDLIGEISPVIRVGNEQDIIDATRGIHDLLPSEEAILNQLRLAAASVGNASEMKALCSLTERLLTLFAHGDRPKIAMLFSGMRAKDLKELSLEAFTPIPPKTGSFDVKEIDAMIAAAKDTDTKRVKVEHPIILDMAIRDLEEKIPVLRAVQHIKSGKEELIKICEEALRLLTLIREKDKTIQDYRISKAANHARDILNKVTTTSDRAQDPKYAHIHVPTSLERKLNVMVALANNITVQEPEDVIEISKQTENEEDRKILESLRTVLEQGKRLRGTESAMKTNVAAEELVGLILRTPKEKKKEEEGYYELAEYLLISVAGSTYEAPVTEEKLQEYAEMADRFSGNLIPTDAEKIREINNGLRRLEVQMGAQKAHHHDQTKVSDNFNINRAYTFASGLIARLLLTLPRQKPNSQLDTNFKRFMAYIGSAFRSMEYISKAEEKRATSQLLRSVEAQEKNPAAEQPQPLPPKEELVSQLAGGIEMDNWLDDLEG